MLQLRQFVYSFPFLILTQVCKDHSVELDMTRRTERQRRRYWTLTNGRGDQTMCILPVGPDNIMFILPVGVSKWRRLSVLE